MAYLRKGKQARKKGGDPESVDEGHRHPKMDIRTIKGPSGIHNKLVQRSDK